MSLGEGWAREGWARETSSPGCPTACPTAHTSLEHNPCFVVVSQKTKFNIRPCLTPAHRSAFPKASWWETPPWPGLYHVTDTVTDIELSPPVSALSTPLPGAQDPDESFRAIAFGSKAPFPVTACADPSTLPQPHAETRHEQHWILQKRFL